jgi:hypothetical protein
VRLDGVETRMRIWLALIVAPLLALADQAVAFSMVGWACAHQTPALLHASHALFLVLATATAVAAGLHWRETDSAAASTREAARQVRFLAGIATTVATLSALAIAAMWVPTWMISSCIA